MLPGASTPAEVDQIRPVDGPALRPLMTEEDTDEQLAIARVISDV